MSSLRIQESLEKPLFLVLFGQMKNNHKFSVLESFNIPLNLPADWRGNVFLFHPLNGGQGDVIYSKKKNDYINLTKSS